MTELFAEVAWQIGDIQTLRPNLTDKEAAEWLADNEHNIQGLMVERGWAAIEDLLSWDFPEEAEGSENA